jgi:hypothetical protein
MRSLAAALALTVGLVSQAAPDAGPPSVAMADSPPPLPPTSVTTSEMRTQFYSQDLRVPKSREKLNRPKPVKAKRPVASVEHWRPLVAAHPDWPVDTILRAMACESRGDPTAKNPRSTATGLLQVLGGSTDPATNVAQAHSIWRRQGLAAWRACL